MAPPSPSKTLCWKCQGETAGGWTCPHCATVQEVPETITYFQVLGVPAQLQYDPEGLRTLFYEKAKQVHPDRFATKSAREMNLAARWTQLLNRAYQTLKTRRSAAAYLLEWVGHPTESKPKIPLDLAEEYFALQDMLSQNESEEGYAQFLGKLNSLRTDMESEWRAIAEEWKRSPQPDNRVALNRLAEMLVKEKYLDSMLADIDKKLGN